MAIGIRDDTRGWDDKGAGEGFSSGQVHSMQYIDALIVNLSRQVAYAKL